MQELVKRLPCHADLKRSTLVAVDGVWGCQDGRAVDYRLTQMRMPRASRANPKFLRKCKASIVTAAPASASTLLLLLLCNMSVREILEDMQEIIEEDISTQQPSKYVRNHELLMNIEIPGIEGSTVRQFVQLHRDLSLQELLMIFMHGLEINIISRRRKSNLSFWFQLIVYKFFSFISSWQYALDKHRHLYEQTDLYIVDKNYYERCRKAYNDCVSELNSLVPQ